MLALFTLFLVSAEPVDGDGPAELTAGKLIEAKWHDCSKEEKITNPKFKFSDVRAVPPIFTPGQNQTVYKTITYTGNDELDHVVADYSQYFQVLGYWVRWMRIADKDECKMYSNLCPVQANSTTHLSKQHAHISSWSPFGWYRSRQVYKDGKTQEKLGCVNIEFEYRKRTNDDNVTSAPKTMERSVAYI